MWASLQPGDALLLDGWPLTRDAAGGIAGPVVARGPSVDHGGDRGCSPRTGASCYGASRCRSARRRRRWATRSTRGGLIEAIGEVPVVVRVELGEARMAARDWAALGRGDVIALGRRVGESVLLRVGGVPVARGDLVEIDGEVGVRIVERLAADGAQR